MHPQLQQLTPAAQQKVRSGARAAHNAAYAVDYPPPQLADSTEAKTGIERAVGYLWVVWLILAIAGAVISLPHTLATVLNTVDLPAVVAVGYSLAVFVGLELALIAVALVSELKRLQDTTPHEPRKQASLAGLVNALCRRIGLRWAIDTSHLPDRTPASGLGLIAFLFLVSAVFNLSDAMRETALLASYSTEITTVAKFSSGILAPVLLLFAGHRFAAEVVIASTTRRRAEAAHNAAYEQWQAELQSSWLENQDDWFTAEILSKKSYRDKVDFYQAAALRPKVSQHNGNGRH